MIKIFLVEDERLVREALKALLQDANNFEVIGEAATGESALEKIREKRPQIVLLDINLPDVNGFHIAQELLNQHPDLKVIILTAASSDIFPKRLLEIGAHGYITKDISRDSLIQTIQTVFKGGLVISPNIANQLAFTTSGLVAKSVFEILTDREMEVMLMVLRGETIPKIASRLHLNPKTISMHRMAILKKLKVENEVELLLLATKEGLVDIERSKDSGI